MLEKEVSEILSQNGLEIVLTYAPVGLGHLRDMDALKDGLPKGVKSSIFLSESKSIRFFYRLISTNPLLRGLMEFIQSGLPQTIYTFFYRYNLRSDVKEVREYLWQEIKNKKPKKLVIVATHFGFAHQVAAVKKELEGKTGCQIILIVQVTDDSPQYIWYVDGADLTFVTSEYVKKGLAEYGRKRHVPPIKMEINPCPINPSLSGSLTAEEMTNKKNQADPTANTPIHILVPISGAAVGMGYVFDLMERLHDKSNRFIFHVVSKIAPYTKNFLAELKDKDYIKVYASEKDKEVVDLYQEVLKNNVILLEITKPSEHAFKAVLEPNVRGGVLMLFTRPVGRQEYENLDYLIRRNLVPQTQENNKLWSTALLGKEYSGNISNLDAGMSIPFKPEAAGEFIEWCLEKGVFAKMLLNDRKAKREEYPNELSGEGVKMFWEKTAGFLASLAT
jgi:hypothetical protein